MHKFLLIDDEPDSLNLLCEMVQVNHRSSIILKSSSAETALPIAKKEIPDIIITDWQMPEMCGYELLKKLKQCDETKNIPVIIATGKMTSAEHLKEAFEFGASDFIKKPFERLELNARIDSILRFHDLQKEMIAMKNKEIALHTMYLHSKSEFEAKLQNRLEALSQCIQKGENIGADLIEELTSEIKSNTHKLVWKDIQTSLEQVQPAFTNKLARRYPGLTPSETRLCVLLSMNMDSKTIANILHLSADSVKIARKRLRKKLNLSSDDNLVSILQAI